MDINQKVEQIFSNQISHLSMKDFEKRIFNTKKYIGGKNGI
ncbi:MAG: hypothetical protein V1663_03015 [archaeon]